ncbi:MAG: hypothetical protein QXK80_01870 [Candidatus Pacearchaeota archaeon]
MKKRYKCNNCGFSFESERDIVRCPYCDKVSIFIDIKDEELIKDIDDILK